MQRLLVLIVLSSALGGCGLADSGAAGAAGAASEAQEASQAKQKEERVRAQIEAAQSQAAEREHSAEEAAK